MSDPELRSFEASVLQELESFVLEARGARALAGLGPDASLERDLGLGSLERVELLSRLESRFRRTPPERTLGEAETARDLARAFLDAPATSAEPTELLEPSSAISFGSFGPRESTLTLVEARTLTAVLKARAQRCPELPHIYLKEDERPEETVSYGELYRDSLLVASALRARGLATGDRVAIMLPTCRAFFSTFMGALLTGGVPVPLYPPFRRAHIGEYAERQAAILRNAQARFFVTVPEGIAVGGLLRASCPSLSHVLSSDEVLTTVETPARSPWEEAAPSDPALIQYTSGSTGEPKGVLLTHENLIANIRAIGATLRIGPRDVGVSWLPLYHDMGLIGAWLTPLYFGIPVAILSPVAFLTRPHRWLWTIHRRRGTISPAPNFAYELAARKIDERDIEGLDLGSWRVALNGAEPVSPRTLERFTKKFGRHGFQKTSFLPVYGLAEASLLLAAPELEREVRVETLDREAFQSEGIARPPSSKAEPMRFVSAGKVIRGHELLIVDEEGNPLPERREGRLLFRGPSVMRGYFRNDAATLAVRRDDGFLDSGDRAFLAEGELFLTGRAKDLIIKAGRNLVPQELEEAASGVEGVRGGSVAAFGIEDADQGTERIVVVVESREQAEESKARIETDVGRRIADVVGIAPDEVLVLPPRALPKTSSGKIRRNACREGYLRGELGRRAKGSRRVAFRLLTRSAFAWITHALTKLARLVYGGYVFFCTAGLVLPTWVLVRLGLPRGPLRAIVRHGSRLYLWLAGVPVEIRGREILEEIRGPAIFVSNHASYLDPVPVMAALDRDYAFVVKKEAFSWPFLGRALGRLEHVAVERARADESVASTERMKAELARGRSLVLFPEGTFTRFAGLRPFKLGAFQLAAESGVPVVPLALCGTRRLLRDGTWIPKRGAVRVELGAPIVTESGFAGTLRARDETAETISRLSGEPRLDLVAAGLEYS